MPSVVLTQVTKVYGDQYWFKGTVGGAAFSAIYKNKFLNVADATQPAKVAEWFANLYQQIIDLSAAELNSRALVQRMSDGRDINIVYAATPVAFVGYDMLEISGTVAGIAAKALISYDDFLSAGFSSGPGKNTLQNRVAELLYTSQVNDLNMLNAFTATFPSVTTTSSASTTASTTTTT